MKKFSKAFQASYTTILEVTFETLRHDSDLKLCEGLRLIEATRTAVARRAPEELENFETSILPSLRTALLERFGLPSDYLSN